MAGAYYWHRFYAHQPDLNFENPKVHEAVFKTLDFWLDMGVDGMRLDAVPYLYEQEGTNCENLPQTHAFLKKLRQRVDEKYSDRMLLAEANQWPEDAAAYFGEGDECHMNFHFPLMPRLFMALQMESRHPVVDILEQTPDIPENCQWAIFLRNHDELTLEMVTDEERDYMYRVYARDPRMRINLGIRRRLSPLMGNHRRRIEMMKGLLLSLPGTPVIYYGDEIGMGDNIYLGDRNGVRTPMQWSADRNAGFSKANPQKLYLPVIIDPEYHYEVVNVEAQRNNRHSLLWWIRRLITLRGRIKAFSRGSLTFLHPENEKILGFVRQYEEERILVVANFSRFAQFTTLNLSAYKDEVPVEVFGNNPFPVITEEPYMLTMGPHTFYWFNLVPESTLETAPEARIDADALPEFNVQRRWEELFESGASQRLTRCLAAYMAGQRWFGAKGRRIKNLTIQEVVPIRRGTVSALLLFVSLQYTDGTPESYILTVASASPDQAEPLLEKFPGAAIARIRTQVAELHGFLVDGLMLPEVCQALQELIHRRLQVKGRHGRLAALANSTPQKKENQIGPSEAISILGAEQSNTSVVFGERMILKLFRRLQEGINPDVEIGRFLTRKGFANLPPVLGALEYRSPDQEPSTVAVLQGYVRNQGDAWQYTLDHLSRFYEHILESKQHQDPELTSDHLLETAAVDLPDSVSEHIGIYMGSAQLLAKHTAQMHRLLASDPRDAAFAPEPFSKLYQRSLYQSMSAQTKRVLVQLEKNMSRLSEDVRPAGELVLSQKGAIIATFQALMNEKLTGRRIRCHGDFHLGQVLFTGKDFVIIDFEGEPARAISERRIKRSPLRDVAGMLRSFHYAAYNALINEKARGLFHEADRAYMESWCDYWYGWVAAAYLKHYLERCAQADFLPDTSEQIRILLDAFLLDKAVYELGYEMNNRPQWIRLPLQGIARLLGTGAGE